MGDPGTAKFGRQHGGARRKVQLNWAKINQGFNQGDRDVEGSCTGGNHHQTRQAC
jgi:hypothetical protein